MINEKTGMDERCANCKFYQPNDTLAEASKKGLCTKINKIGQGKEDYTKTHFDLWCDKWENHMSPKQNITAGQFQLEEEVAVDETYRGEEAMHVNRRYHDEDIDERIAYAKLEEVDNMLKSLYHLKEQIAAEVSAGIGTLSSSQVLEYNASAMLLVNIIKGTEQRRQLLAYGPAYSDTIKDN